MVDDDDLVCLRYHAKEHNLVIGLCNDTVEGDCSVSLQSAFSRKLDTCFDLSDANPTSSRRVGVGRSSKLQIGQKLIQ
jgi:hypothetical protein